MSPSRPLPQVVDVSLGSEDTEPGSASKFNMVEMEVVLQLLQTLRRFSKAGQQPLSVGVVSPYALQVSKLEAEVARTSRGHSEFDVQVKSVDGFQVGTG